MKYINILVTSLLLLIATSCSDFDINPAGDAIGQSQKDDVYEKDPEKLQAEVNAFAANMIEYNVFGQSSTNAYHWDFGYPAVCLLWEAPGADVSTIDHGYNKFINAMKYNDRQNNSVFSEFIWRLFYKQIRASNGIIATTEGTEDQRLKYFRGQALGARAFSYLSLVQTYQYTYKGHESALAVPIVTEKTTPEEIANNPRATVEAVYNLIISDLTEAISLLNGFSRASKDAINLNVAYGLRARANLIMENWAEAAADAEQALQGYTPYSLSQVSRPTFNNANASSWIWGNIYTEDADAVKTGICNWPSLLCSLTGGGYAVQTGAYMVINSNLWKEIPAGDVRKGWWVDENLKSPLLNGYISEEELGDLVSYRKYTNVKFGSYKDEPLSAINASDWPVMRAEEMILIKAEAQAMGGSLSQGKSTLEDFVKNYRYAGFSSTASSAKDLQDEVWFQRRVELWGEGFSFFDLKRLGKNVIRYDEVTRESNFAANAKFNVPITDPIILWQIPQKELNTNEGIQENNAVGRPPVPVS